MKGYRSLCVLAVAVAVVGVITIGMVQTLLSYEGQKCVTLQTATCKGMGDAYCQEGGSICGYCDTDNTINAKMCVNVETPYPSTCTSTGSTLCYGTYKVGNCRLNSNRDRVCANAVAPIGISACSEGLTYYTCE
jgi:hypothetical protein